MVIQERGNGVWAGFFVWQLTNAKVASRIETMNRMWLAYVWHIVYSSPKSLVLISHTVLWTLGEYITINEFWGANDFVRGALGDLSARINGGGERKRAYWPAQWKTNMLLDINFYCAPCFKAKKMLYEVGVVSRWKTWLERRYGIVHTPKRLRLVEARRQEWLADCIWAGRRPKHRSWMSSMSKQFEAKKLRGIRSWQSTRTTLQMPSVHGLRC